MALDRITQDLVAQFVANEDLSKLNAADQFERFVNFAVVSAEHSETFGVEDVSGPGEEVGIDGLAVLVNGVLVTSPEQVDELAERNGYVEATFVFLSAKRTSNFSEAELGNLALGVADFFGEAKLPRTPFLENYLEIKEAVYAKGARFTRGLPRLKLFYVTLGKWEEPEVVVRRIELEQQRFEDLEIFEKVEINALGAKQIRDLYIRTQNPVANEFTLAQKVTLPAIPGVTQAYLGIMPAKEYVRLIADESGQLRKSLFTDNVRDFRGEGNPVNTSIAETLESNERDRFCILNNGVTIVARDLRVTGNTLYMQAYQVVNGGQTSHVLFNQQELLDDTVWVPIRVIGTDSDDLTTAVITATNSQTPVEAQELNSRSTFERDLERFFDTFQDQQALYYERRSKQYGSVTDIEKVRIITRDQLVRAYAAMFLDEPHRATGYVPALLDQLGGRIMHAEDKLEPYYASAFAHYKLEFFWRNKQLDSQYKPGRFQILMAARHLAIGAPVGRSNSREIAEKADELSSVLWADNDALKVFKEAIGIVNDAVQGNWKRDHMRNQPTTQDVLSQLNRL